MACHCSGSRPRQGSLYLNLDLPRKKNSSAELIVAESENASGSVKGNVFVFSFVPVACIIWLESESVEWA